MKKILCMLSRPPYHSSHDLELVEAAMVGAVFDMKVSVLFRGEGVWALLDGQDADALGVRTFSKVLSALPTYEVDDIYVCSDSLAVRNIDVAELVLPVQMLTPTQQGELMQSQDAVLGAQS